MPSLTLVIFQVPDRARVLLQLIEATRHELSPRDAEVIKRNVEAFRVQATEALPPLPTPVMEPIPDGRHLSKVDLQTRKQLLERKRDRLIVEYDRTIAQIKITEIRSLVLDCLVGDSKRKREAAMRAIEEYLNDE